MKKKIEKSRACDMVSEGIAQQENAIAGLKKKRQGERTGSSHKGSLYPSRYND